MPHRLRETVDTPRVDTVRSPLPIAPGRILRNRYVIQKRLGSGAAGSVYEALDRNRPQLPEIVQSVALRVLRSIGDDRSRQPDDPRRAFYSSLSLSHPNIVKVHELDRDEEVEFFTMELLDGERLIAVMDRLRIAPMPRAYAWRVIHEIGAGLAHAHARNVVHGNLMPHNVMITHSGDVRILDFGGTGTLCAVRPAYASCELLAGRAPDARDDLYSLACITYELLAGTHPFQRRPSTVARNLAIVPQRPPGLTQRQWKMIVMGLSWHRAARSIPVGTWLEQLKAGRATARRLPDVSDLKPDSGGGRPAPPLTAASLFLVLLITAGTAVSISGRERSTAGAGSPPLAPATDIGPTQAATQANQAAAPAANALLNSPGRATSAADALSNPTARTTSAPAPTAAAPVAAMTVAAAPAPFISVEDCKVLPGGHFAEIRVHRTAGMAKNAAFTWWTEPASAKPGVDYVQQGKVTQSFPKGKNSTSFFIRLVPNAARKRSVVLYIAITEAGSAAPGQFARAAVWLPTARAQS